MKSHKPQEQKLESTMKALQSAQKLAKVLRFLESPPMLVLTSLFFMVSVAALFLTGRDDYDLWWHLRYGEHFVSHHTWTVDQATYSWTPTIIKWKYCTWLGSSILYLTFNSFSIEGLIAFKWIIFSSVFGLCLLFIRMAGDQLDLTHVAAFFLMAVVYKLNGDYLKPERFSDIFFVITVFIYAHTKVTERRLFYLYPFIFIFWVNIHGGFINGLVFITVAFIGETVNTYILKNGSTLSKKIIHYFGIMVFLSYVVTLINPSGLEYHLSLFREYTTAGSAAHVATERIYAWKSMWAYLFPSPDSMRILYSYAAWCQVILFTVFCIVVILNFKKNRSFETTLFIVNILFFYLGMKVGRATLYYPFIWFFTILIVLKNAELLHIKRKYVPVAFLICIFWTSLLMYNFATSYLYLQQGSFIHDSVPEKEVQFMKRYKLPTPLFNDYLTGGYLLWAAYPEYKVFVDPRQAPYMETVLPDYFDFLDNPTPEKLDRLNEKYPFKTAIIRYDQIPMVSAFYRSPSWRLVYFEKNNAIFVHASKLSALPEEARTAYLGASRFWDVKNPVPLAFLFEIYIHLDPREAAEICTIFNHNVSDLYRSKHSILKTFKERLPSAQVTQ